MIPNDYEELNKSLQEWYSQRPKRSVEEPSERSDKRVKLNMMRGSQKERPRYEDIKEVGYKIRSQGAIAKKVKDQKIDEIDKEQDRLLAEQIEIRRGNYSSRREREKERLFEREIALL